MITDGTTRTIACPGCGALVPDIEGPTHKYVPSSPGCWKTFGELQADEVRRFGYPSAHRLAVDAYMAQHPGNGSDRRDRQSVFVHLVGLCAALEHDLPPAIATRLLGGVIRRRGREFPVLRRTAGPGRVTVLHLAGAADLTDYERRAREWAAAVWESWREHQELIRAELDAALIASGS